MQASTQYSVFYFLCVGILLPAKNRIAEKRDKNRRSRYNNDRWKLHRHTSRSHRLFEPRLDGIWGRKGDAPQKRRERVQLLLFRKWIGTQLWNLSLGIRQGSVCADKQYYQVYSGITESEYRNYYVAVLRLLINWLLLKPHSKNISPTPPETLSVPTGH